MENLPHLAMILLSVFTGAFIVFTYKIIKEEYKKSPEFVTDVIKKFFLKSLLYFYNFILIMCLCVSAYFLVVTILVVKFYGLLIIAVASGSFFLFACLYLPVESISKVKGIKKILLKSFFFSCMFFSVVCSCLSAYFLIVGIISFQLSAILFIGLIWAFNCLLCGAFQFLIKLY